MSKMLDCGMWKGQIFKISIWSNLMVTKVVIRGC